MSETALATTGVPLPAHIAAMAKKDAYADQFGAISGRDIKLNIIQIVYGDDRRTKPGWGVAGNEPALPVKTMVLSQSGQIIPPGTPFVPVFRSVRYIAWTGRPGDGQMLFSTINKDDERIKHFLKDPATGRWISGLAFLKDPRTGETMAPAVTEYINFFIMLPICEWPCLLSLKRSSTPSGHKLTSDILMATITKDGERIPIYSLMFKFGEPKTIDENSPKPYYHLTWQPAGFTTRAETFAKAAELSVTAEALNSITTPEELEGEEAEDKPSAPPLRQVTPETPGAPGYVRVVAPPTQPITPTTPTTPVPSFGAAPAAPPAPPVAVPPAPTPTVQVPPLPNVAPAQPPAPPPQQLAPNIALF